MGKWGRWWCLRWLFVLYHGKLPFKPPFGEYVLTKRLKQILMTTTFGMHKTLVNNRINYQPQPVKAAINSMLPNWSCDDYVVVVFFLLEILYRDPRPFWTGRVDEACFFCFFSCCFVRSSPNELFGHKNWKDNVCVELEKMFLMFGMGSKCNIN